MDNLPTSQPQVFITKENFFQTAKGKALTAALATVIFIISAVTLNYFVFSRKLTLSCPIQGQNCKQNKPIIFNNNPAAAFKLPAGSKIVSPVEVLDTKQFILPPFTEDALIGLYQSFILGDICYTLTYTVPSDSTIERITTLSLNSNSQLITTGSRSIKIGNEDLNLILQIQKRLLDKNAKTDTQKCPVYYVDPKDYGEFDQISF